MSQVKPLIGFAIVEDCTDDMSDWSGQITYPDPRGASLAWMNAIKMIEYDAYRKSIEALKSARKRLSHIENWHRDYVTPNNFKDCQDVGMTPEKYLRDGKIEIDKTLKELGVWE